MALYEYPFDVFSLEIAPCSTCAQKESRNERTASVTESFSRKKACVFLEILDEKKKFGLGWSKIAHLRPNFAIVT